MVASPETLVPIYQTIRSHRTQTIDTAASCSGRVKSAAVHHSESLTRLEVSTFTLTGNLVVCSVHLLMHLYPIKTQFQYRTLSFHSGIQIFWHGKQLPSFRRTVVPPSSEIKSDFSDWRDRVTVSKRLGGFGRLLRAMKLWDLTSELHVTGERST